MRGWVPVPGSTKARLVEGALAEFGARGYAAVGVTELAAVAGVTTGSLYHHFGSKLGLYDAVRADVEQRVLDRMEGAAAVGAGVGDLLLVGFDYLVRTGYARLLSERHPDRAADPMLSFVSSKADHGGRPVGRVLMAAWRAALDASTTDEAAAVRAALAEVVGSR
jgi:AcrR family transcriptional regulator